MLSQLSQGSDFCSDQGYHLRAPADTTLGALNTHELKLRKGPLSYVGACSVTQGDSVTATPWTVACQAPLFLGFPRQEYQSGLPFPPPGDLPDPGMKPSSPESPLSRLGRPFCPEV